MKRRAITILIVCAGTLAAGALIFGGRASAKTKQETVYKTTKIIRGDIEETVSSTGNLKAVGTVNVLAQLTGTLEKVYVDFNDTVTKNQPLAEINTDKLKITLKEAAAAKDKAQAQAEYDAAEYQKSRSLQASALISDSDFAAKRLSFLTSKASLEQAEASYDEARLNIDKYAIVLSPITGIVLDRAVEEGETVVGSGSTNTQLFTLAENLRQMEIEAAVDEMDISRVKLGQSVRFTVEAYPDRKFSGAVSQIRIVPTSSDNVVSYTVIVRAENADGVLLPGMTATVDFLVNQKKDVILVPSTAFRFTPSDEVASAARRKAFESRIADLGEAERAKAIKEYDARVSGGGQQAGSLLGGGARRFPGGGGGPPGGPGGPGGPGASGSTGSSDTRKILWILDDDGTVSMHVVEAGASDGTNTEIVNGDALTGLAAIVRGQ